MEFRDEFAEDELNTEVWIPHYLPQWSSRAASAAAYDVTGSELRLTIPAAHPLWCPDDHLPPLRVSGVQSGVFSGAAGTMVGQQPFLERQLVREAQPAQWGWTPTYGRIEARARMELSSRSMASVWMVGREEVPQQSGEICVFEVFGEAPEAIGMGIHPFRDPALTDEFDAMPMPIDITEPHDYAVDWSPSRVDWSIDGRHVKTVSQAPAYAMQMMIALFDFPENPGPADHVPLLAVDYVRGLGLSERGSDVTEDERCG